MHTNQVKKPWYKKKRYAIPLSIVGLFILIGIFGPKTPQNNQVQGEDQKANVTTSPDQTINIPGKLNAEEPKKDEPASTPATTAYATPYATPYQTPYSTPYKTPTVTPYGTPSQKEDSNCDPNYSGCVPIASDVDCAGGTGNGPAYVKGPVKVIGSDIYKLDSDHDGIACD